MFGRIKELYEYKSMIFSLVRRDLRGRYKGSLLGFLWNFIIPIMQIIVYVLVFTVVFRQNIEHYYIYLVVGIVPWTLFADSIGAGSGSIIDNSQLVSKIYFPRSVIPISIVISKFVNFVISMVFVFILIAVSGHGFSPVALLMLPVAIIFLFMFSLGLSMLLSALDVYMRDVQYMVTVILMLFIWLTPIMYVKDFIDNWAFQTMLNLNPMTYLIGMFQDILYWCTVPGWQVIVISAALAVVMLAIGVLIFERLSRDFAEVL